MSVNSETDNWSKCRQVSVKYSDINGTSISHLLPQKTQITLWKSEQKECKSQSWGGLEKDSISTCDRTIVFVNSCQLLLSSQQQASQHSNMMGIVMSHFCSWGSSGELLDGWRGRENKFSLQVCSHAFRMDAPTFVYIDRCSTKWSQ